MSPKWLKLLLDRRRRDRIVCVFHFAPKMPAGLTRTAYHFAVNPETAATLCVGSRRSQPKCALAEHDQHRSAIPQFQARTKGLSRLALGEILEDLTVNSDIVGMF